MYISPLIITQSAAQFVVEKDFFPSVVCLILLGWCVAGLQLKGHLKHLKISTEDVSLFSVWTQPPKDARPTQTQEQECPNMTFASRWDGREWEDQLMCMDAHIDIQPAVGLSVTGCANMHTCMCLFIFSPLSQALACFFLFNRHPPPHTHSH